MAELRGELQPEDIQLLIDAVGFWEKIANQEYYMLERMKNVIIPEESDADDEYELEEDEDMRHHPLHVLRQLRHEFLKREREILATKSLREEQATFLKAKLMLIRQDQTAEKLTDPDTFDDLGEIPKKPFISTSKKKGGPSKKAENDPAKLKRAEAFMGEKNILGYYQEYLLAEGKESSIDLAEFYINDCGMAELYKEYLDQDK